MKNTTMNSKAKTKSERESETKSESNSAGQNKPKKNSSTDWKNKPFRSAYNSEYAKRHPRVLLGAEDYHLINQAFKKQNQQKKLGSYIRSLAINQLKRQNGEPEPNLTKEDARSMIVLLRNATNNINQTAHRLNEKALKQKRRIVENQKNSISILEDCYTTLEKLENQLQHYFKHADE